MAIRQLGLSYHVEYTNCEKDLVNNLNQMKELMLEACRIAGVKIVHDFFQVHHTNVSGVALGADSHFNLHSNTDLKYVGLEIFTSQFDLKIQSLIDFLAEGLKAQQVSWQKYHRGTNSQLKPFRENHSVSRSEFPNC